MDRGEERASVTQEKFDAALENPEAEVCSECSYLIWFRVAKLDKFHN